MKRLKRPPVTGGDRHKPRRFVGIPFDIAERALHASAGLSLADTIKAACIEYAERRAKPKRKPAGYPLPLQS